MESGVSNSCFFWFILEDTPTIINWFTTSLFRNTVSFIHVKFPSWPRGCERGCSQSLVVSVYFIVSVSNQDCFLGEGGRLYRRDLAFSEVGRTHAGSFLIKGSNISCEQCDFLSIVLFLSKWKYKLSFPEIKNIMRGADFFWGALGEVGAETVPFWNSWVWDACRLLRGSLVGGWTHESSLRGYFLKC